MESQHLKRRNLFASAIIAVGVGLVFAFNNCSPRGFESASEQSLTNANSGEPKTPLTLKCPTDYKPPAGTTIIKIGDKDDYEKRDFDIVFDNPGSAFNSVVGIGQTKALQFTNNDVRRGVLSSEAGSYGDGYKDWSVSSCPGDFSASLPKKCLVLHTTSINMYYSTDGSQGCTIPVDSPVYLNVRSATEDSPAGWVMENLVLEKLDCTTNPSGGAALSAQSMSSAWASPNTNFFASVAAGKIQPFSFVNNSITKGKLNVLSANSTTIRVWISACPGAAQSSVPAACSSGTRAQGTGQIWFSSTDATRCVIPADGRTWYVNVENTSPTSQTELQAVVYREF